MVASGVVAKNDQATRAFPLAAITGHGTLKLALLLAAVSSLMRTDAGERRPAHSPLFFFARLIVITTLVCRFLLSWLACGSIGLCGFVFIPGDEFS